ncbi:tyrosine--tRNA ligase [Halosimplex pelagicum]|uniref:Tyrosine--tRNA ligase n=1 Tax=Halosimplex pelagicum TaxID=869886 RepID=A0A7D5PGD9_9EURY|nr:tyrosine--tRNA ligase [Halosimplex pelagicum]QLH83779.1 tyrosine--tRNA ligase [Halosimplex pelagicum]
MGDLALLTRNAEESLPAEEVRAVANSPVGKRAYVGYEPSGVLHLGHMLTANKLIDLQNAGMDVVVLLADVHAYLNGKGTFDEIRDTAEQMRDQFVAYGLDESSTEFVLGSKFQFDDDYVLDLNALALETTLNRAQRAMADIQGGETATVAHVMYPLMQALDIEYLDLDLAVGGLDQRKVHMLQRDMLPAIGYTARPAIHTPILADLTTGIGKMSSSTNPVTGGESLTISFEDDTATLQEKVENIFFPPERDPVFEDYYEPTNYGLEPAEATLHNPGLQLFEYHVFPRFESVVVDRPDEYGGDVEYDSYEALADAVESGDLHPADAKSALATYLDDLIAPGRAQLE